MLQQDPIPLPPANTPEPPEPSPPEEPTPMLDVHPAHHAASTWRDFFIHIATICLGLLIAIGLEQTVEWVHHRHQLHQLEADLHTEGLRNLHVALDNIHYSELRRNNDAAQYAELVNAARQHRAPATLPSSQGTNYAKPAYAVWVVAQQSGTSALLPREDAQRYVRLYSVVQTAAEHLDAINAAASRRSAAILPSVADLTSIQDFPTHGQSLGYNLSLLTPEDLRLLRDAIANDLATARLGINQNVYLYGIQWAIVNGSRSDEANIGALYDAMNVYLKGGTAALTAKYPLPTDAVSPNPTKAAH
jgi:hypothetical protein